MRDTRLRYAAPSVKWKSRRYRGCTLQLPSVLLVALRGLFCRRVSSREHLCNAGTLISRHITGSAVSAQQIASLRVFTNTQLQQSIFFKGVGLQKLTHRRQLQFTMAAFSQSRLARLPQRPRLAAPLKKAPLPRFQHVQCRAAASDDPFAVSVLDGVCRAFRAAPHSRRCPRGEAVTGLLVQTAVFWSCQRRGQRDDRQGLLEEEE